MLDTQRGKAKVCSPLRPSYGHPNIPLFSARPQKPNHSREVRPIQLRKRAAIVSGFFWKLPVRRCHSMPTRRDIPLSQKLNKVALFFLLPRGVKDFFLLRASQTLTAPPPRRYLQQSQLRLRVRTNYWLL